MHADAPTHQREREKLIPMESLSIDIEVTNRCNAKCHFCPRDRTPHQGLMQPDLFAVALDRASEYRQICLDRLNIDVGVSLCGLGEPLLNKHLVDYVAQTRAAGFGVTISSNGSLLTAEKGRQLLDAGLQNIFINVGEIGDDYEAVYELPFERTLENVVRFNEMAGDQCVVTAVLVDHRGDPDHIKKLSQYWTDHGITQIVSYEVMNRGGSLFVDHMQYEAFPELLEAKQMLAERVQTPACGAPFVYLFIGYDGQYYLCCSDWEKQAPMGHVSDLTFLDVTAAKLSHVASREPVCRTCNLDPINRLTSQLKAENEGTVAVGSSAELLEELVTQVEILDQVVERLGHPMPTPESAVEGRRLIPVRSL